MSKATRAIQIRQKSSNPGHLLDHITEVQKYHEFMPRIVLMQCLYGVWEFIDILEDSQELTTGTLERWWVLYKGEVEWKESRTTIKSHK